MSTHNNNANSVSNNIGLIHNIKSRLKRITRNLREHARSEKFTHSVEVLSTVQEEDEQYQKEVIENDRLTGRGNRLPASGGTGRSTVMNFGKKKFFDCRGTVFLVEPSDGF